MTDTTYRIQSLKRDEIYCGDFPGAVNRARKIQAEYQSAFGTQIFDTDGTTIWDSECAAGCFGTMNDTLNFHFNGDVTRSHGGMNETLIGRIDSDADWIPESDCPWTEDEIKREIADQVVELGDSWVWPIEQLTFAEII